MKNKFIIALLLITVLPVPGFSANANKKTVSGISLKTNTGTTPATQPKEEKGIKNNLKRYDILAFGAISDGKTLNSKAIQAAIDKCAQSGGGTVVIPKGEFLSGALFLKPGVNLELQEGAMLKGSTDIKDYPKATTRIEGHFEPWPAALLNGDKVDHLHITGPGILDGNGQPFWQEFYRRRNLDHKTTNLNVERPRLTFIQNSKNVQISGITFKNSGFWNLHVYRCQQVVVDNCRFLAPYELEGPAPSTDGIDVDSSQDITITNSYFAVGDDDIALKGSKGPFAMDDKDSPAVERIHISNCTFKAGGGIVTAGSEATIVRDVDIQHCTTTKPTVLRLKLRPDTPQQYENIRLNDITVEGSGAIFNISPWKQYFDLKGQQPPKSQVRFITISNVKGWCGSFGKIIGNPDTDFGEIILKNVDVKMKDTKFEPGDIKGLKFENVVVNGEAMSVPSPTVTPALVP
ncbi:MAG: glycosyl hydrolase family 28 protein [Paludibacter sp.]|nr:glycosyl hydrolase family 28 protein [Paludibacter sp.]